ncbi:MAG: LysM peptidoglycan-binding domain-containing protein [Bacteroidota bacterium]
MLIPNGEGSSDFGVLALSTAKAKPSVEATTIQAEEKLEVNGVPVIRARKGETIASIAQRGDVGLRAFLRNNEMAMDKPLKEGELYFLERKKKKAVEELYTVKTGEDLWLVSQRFGVQQKAILKYNRLDKNLKLASGITLFLNSRKPSGISVTDESAIATLDEGDSFNWDQPVAGKTAAVVPVIILDKQLPMVAPEDVNSSPLAVIASDSTGEIAFHEVKSSDTLYSVARQYGVHQGIDGLE